VPLKKNKKTEAKKKSAVASRNVKAKTQKKTAAVAAKAVKPKAQKVKTAKVPVVSVKKSKPQAKIVKPKVEKKAVVVAKNVRAKTKTDAAVQKTKPQLKGEKTKVAAIVKNGKPAKKPETVSVRKTAPKLKPQISAKAVKLPKQKTKAEKIVKKPFETKIEVEPVALMPKRKPVNKKAKPIGSAVFRGKKEKYDFQIFPLDEKFEQIKAVYIISKRKTDRKKRGHHKLVCIDQTESIVDGIKKHKKDKCIKHNEANVICLLKEENETNRLRIAADLREAHMIACNKP
jgi:hypothetical protein